MNSKSLRRLAADHGALHNNPLPPNYLFPPDAADTDSLTDLDILLAGPLYTPFSAGVWKLHLTIPPTYPQTPPTANFRTPIFHPNVDPQTGGVCVETLKRDWDAKLTLRDVLVTIYCLLIQPNPDSALNAEAGGLIQEGYEVFERRARLMTSISAGIPTALLEGVRDAQMRGQEVEPQTKEREVEVREDTEVRLDETDVSLLDSMSRPPPIPAPVRRRRGVARLRGAAASRQSEGSPSGAVGTRRQQQLHQPGPSRLQHPQQSGPSNRPFVAQGSSSSDPFGISIREDPPLRTPQLDPSSDDESTTSADQENDSALSPSKPAFAASKPTGTPRRPQGAAPVPLGELSLEDHSSDHSLSSSEEEEEEEEEYPPSPRKKQSPSKSPAKRPQPQQEYHRAPNPFLERHKSSRSAANLFGPATGTGSRNFTPPNAYQNPLTTDSPYTAYDPEDTTMAEPSPSPRKLRTGGGLLFQTPAKKGGEGAARTLFARPTSMKRPDVSTSAGVSGVRKARSRSRSQSPPELSEGEKRRLRDGRLWALCGGDVRKWNRGDFGGEEGFVEKGGRW